MSKFQKLTEVQTLFSEPESSRPKPSSFYTELRKTAIMYKELWEELSSYLPNILIVSQKAEDVYSQVGQIRQQWNRMAFEQGQQTHAENVYNAFCSSVLHEDRERTLNGSQTPMMSLEANKNSKMNFREAHNLNNGESDIENDAMLISGVVNPLYREKKGRNYKVPLRFNGRGDFVDFLADDKLPSRITRKKKEVIATSFCPYFFLAILVIFILGRSFQGPFDAYENQFERNLIVSDVHSGLNDVLQWKLGAINNSIEYIKQDISQNMNRLMDLENKIDSPSAQRYINSFSKTNRTRQTSNNSWTPEEIKNTTTLIVGNISQFMSLPSDNYTTNEPSYIMASYNLQNDYYSALQEYNNWSLTELKGYTEVMPFDTLFGVIFFFCTFFIIFVNFLNLYHLVNLGNDAMTLYLSLAQPELDSLKKSCQAFINYIDSKIESEENGALNFEHSPLKLSASHASAQQRTRIKPLKQWKKPRTELESRLILLVVLLTASSLLLFLIPIPFQKHYTAGIQEEMKEFSALTELEISFLFTYNALKQELITTTPIQGDYNIADMLKFKADGLYQLGQRIDNTSLQVSNNDLLIRYNQLYKDIMTGNFCKLVSQELKEECLQYETGELNNGIKTTLLKKIEDLKSLISQYPSSMSANNSNDPNGLELLKEMNELHIDVFAEKYLRLGMKQLRGMYPANIEIIFGEASKGIIMYEVIIIPIWSILIFILVIKVINPLYRYVEGRKKLIRLIPFSLIVNMKDDLTEFLRDFCELPMNRPTMDNV